MREAEALRFIEITERGRAGNAEYRRPNLFRLNYKPVGRAQATDEWRTIKTEDEAKMLAKTARAAVGPKYSPVVEFTKSQGGNPHRKRQINSGNPPTTDLGGETPTTSISASQRVQPALYVLSSDPQALNQFNAVRFRARPFLIVNNEKKSTRTRRGRKVAA
jgi:hypothetical protein